jgi:ABC-type tungstate transport system substrate-binding protein
MKKKEFLMIAILYSFLWIAVAIKLGDRNWLKYYPTMLFAALGNALYELICYKHQLWQMEPNGLPVSMIPILLLTLIGMPISTWIFLSNFPIEKRFIFKVLYIGIFVLLFVVLEYLSIKIGAITYHHNWNLLWSTIFCIIMFVMLRIHFQRPLLAFFLSTSIAVTFCIIFNVNFDIMK